MNNMPQHNVPDELHYRIEKDASTREVVNEGIMITEEDGALLLHFPSRPAMYDDVRVVIEVSNDQLRAIIYDDPEDEEPKIIPIHTIKNELLHEYDVHFKISGFYTIVAKDEDEAALIVNDIVDQRIGQIEDLLKTGLRDDEYVTQILKA